MKNLLIITMMLFAFAFLSNAQSGTGTCAAPVINSTGTYGGDFYVDVPYQPGDFFVVEVSHDNGTIWVSGKCQSTINLGGHIHLFAPTGSVFGTVCDNDLMRVAKVCHSISGNCDTNDTDYGAFTSNITITGVNCIQQQNNNRRGHGHH